MKKTLIIASSSILVIVALALIAAVCRFNFTNNDIVQPNDEMVNSNEPTWQTFVDTTQKITWQFPVSLLGANYISLAEWPPKISVSKAVLSCPETIVIDSPANTISKRLVDNRSYCVETSGEGAAGSVYTSYTYSTQRDDNLVVAKFTLRYPQCYNYDDPEKTACENEHETFDLDSLIDRIINSMQMVK